MTHTKSVVFLLLFHVVSAGALAGDKPTREILGLRLGMNEAEAHARLTEIGQFVRNEVQEQEVWTVRDPGFSHLLIGFAKDGKLRYVTAVARKDAEARRVPYGSIGDLVRARQAGDPKINLYNYEWSLPADKGEPETLVIALGRDAQYLDMYSLKRLGAGAAGERD